MTQNEENRETFYLYAFVRSDLSPAQQAVQAAHAVLEAGVAFYDPQTQEHPHLIILSVKNERALIKASLKLSHCGYNFKEFREPDIGNELTAIACEPVSGDKRLFFQKYPLMGKTIVAQTQKGESNGNR